MSTPPAILQPPPTVQAPPPKDVPWWGALILAILVSIVSVVGTIFALRGASSAPGAPPGMGALLTDSITFLPHILILFGVLADIFTLQGAYSIPSLVGLCSIPLNYALKFFWDGIAGVLASAYELAMTAPPAQAGGAMSGWDGCEIKGFEFLSSSYAPQGLVVTSTVFWYYLLDLMMNRNPLDSVFTWIAFALFFGLQAMQLKDCANLSTSFFIKTFIALTEGFVIGGTGYGIVQSTIPSRLPSAILPAGPNISSMTKNADGTYVDANGVSYVMGPDGRPIPSSFLAATVAGAALMPATGTTCPGSATAASSAPDLNALMSSYSAK
jgi:hypothetical protein